MESNKIAGFKINGVAALLEKAKSFGIHLDTGGMRLLIFLGSLIAKEESHKKFYHDLRELLSDEVLDQPLEFA